MLLRVRVGARATRGTTDASGSLYRQVMAEVRCGSAAA